MLDITACIITLNEEDNIARCLESVSWANECLVVDSGSEDRTCEIARDYGARVLDNDWPGYRDQKQFAADQAQYDWIFSIDADEEVSSTLAGSIRNHFQTRPSPETSFLVCRKCYFLGRWIEHGSWYPDWIRRLFNRNQSHWTGGDLHERLKHTEKTKKLDGHLFHYPYKNLAENVQYGNYYSGIQANELYEEGKSSGLLKALGHGGFKFIKDYWLKKGILDGMPGFIIATIGSFNVFLKYAKLWEYQETNSEEEPKYPR